MDLIRDIIRMNNFNYDKLKSRQVCSYAWIPGIVLLMGLYGCVSHTPQQTETVTTISSSTPANTAPKKADSVQGSDHKPPRTKAGSKLKVSSGADDKMQIRRGSGQFINESAAADKTGVMTEEGDIVLNFQDTDIQEVIKVVLGDMLHKNYLVEPDVKGKVNLRTSNPINADALLPLFENILRMNDAVLIQERSLYRVVSRAKAARGSNMPRLAQRNRKPRPGYQTYVVPLQFIPASEMKKILDPFLTEGALLNLDEKRNLLMLAGTGQEIDNWLQTIEIFDVDSMKGNSVGLFQLDYAEPKTIINELKKIIIGESEGTSPSLIRFEPIDRLNSVLVVTSQAKYIEEVSDWVEQLDKADGGPGTRLYVYHVKNRKAIDLATVINNMFTGGDISSTQPVSLAPGEKAVTLQSPPRSSRLPTVAGSGKGKTFSSKARGAKQTGISSTQIEAGLLVPEDTSIRIMADEQNNAIVILASATDYKIVEAALKKLDVTPLQVLIEASIIDVNLTEDLQYGVEWFFNNNNVQGDKGGIGTLDLGAAGIAGRAPGFSYTLIDSASRIRAALNLLAEESKLNVLSSPSLMVLDNRTAEIRVGNQIPVRTETAITEGGVSVQSIQFKDTGILLSVTPSVNVGGLVTMEVNQEVTDVGSIDSATGQRTFLQRNIQSVVAVQSGETIVLGGLILENESFGESGIPLLYKIPVLGKLFGQTSKTSDRTELIVLLTPKVIKNQGEANAIRNEFRTRMRNIEKWPSR